MGLGEGEIGRDARVVAVAELTATMVLVMMQGLMVLVVFRGRRRPWLAEFRVPPPTHHTLPPTRRTHGKCGRSSRRRDPRT